MRVGERMQPRRVTGLEPPRLAVEDQHRVFIVRACVPFLRVRHVHRLQRRDDAFLVTNHRFALERLANCLVDFVNLIPALGDDDR